MTPCSVERGSVFLRFKPASWSPCPFTALPSAHTLVRRSQCSGAQILGRVMSRLHADAPLLGPGSRPHGGLSSSVGLGGLFRSHVFGTIWLSGLSLNQEASGIWQGLAWSSSCVGILEAWSTLSYASCPNPCSIVLNFSGDPWEIPAAAPHPPAPCGSWWISCLNPRGTFLSGVELSFLKSVGLLSSSEFLPRNVKAPLVHVSTEPQDSLLGET